LVGNPQNRRSSLNPQAVIHQQTLTTQAPSASRRPPPSATPCPRKSARPVKGKRPQRQPRVRAPLTDRRPATALPSRQKRASEALLLRRPAARVNGQQPRSEPPAPFGGKTLLADASPRCLRKSPFSYAATKRSTAFPFAVCPCDPQKPHSFFHCKGCEKKEKTQRQPTHIIRPGNERGEAKTGAKSLTRSCPPLRLGNPSYDPAQPS
jgi:hypothetical protein